MKIKPTSVIKARLGIEPNGRVQRFLTETCYKHMDKYVPMDNGDLRRNVVLKADSITYQSPYAHYMYIGEVMGPNIPIKENGVIVGWRSPKGKPKHYTGAKIKYRVGGSYWDRNMVTAEIGQVVQEVQDYIRRG